MLQDIPHTMLSGATGHTPYHTKQHSTLSIMHVLFLSQIVYSAWYIVDSGYHIRRSRLCIISGTNYQEHIQSRRFLLRYNYSEIMFFLYLIGFVYWPYLNSSYPFYLRLLVQGWCENPLSQGSIWLQFWPYILQLFWAMLPGLLLQRRLPVRHSVYLR